MLLLTNIDLLYTGSDDLGEIKDAAICIDQNVIEWVGQIVDLPSKYNDAQRKSLRGCIVTPGG
jgi:imidazolonepropionase-like amidohydrolase